MTVVIVLLCLAGFASQLVRGSSIFHTLMLPPTAELLEQGGCSLQMLQEGSWHRLVTSAFLHAGVLHLVLCTLAIGSLGWSCERLVGSWNFLVIFLASMVSSTWIDAVSHGSEVVVGVSGGSFGIVGVMLALAGSGSLRRSVRISMLVAATAAIGGAVFIEWRMRSSMQPGTSFEIGQWAHASGLAVGLGAGLFAVPPNPTARAPLLRVATISLAIVMVVLVGGAMVLAVRPPRNPSCLEEAASRLTSAERAAINNLERAKTPESRATTMQLVAMILRTSKNAYALHRAALLEEQLIQSRWPKYRVQPSVIGDALEATIPCPEANAAWLTIQALDRIQHNDVEGSARSAHEALQELLRSSDVAGRRFGARSLILLVSYAALDPRLAPVASEAWFLAATDPEFLSDPECHPYHVMAALSLGLQRRCEESKRVLAHVIQDGLPRESMHMLGLALYLQGDGVEAVRCMRKALREDRVDAQSIEYWKQMVELPPEEGMKVVQADLLRRPR